MIGQLQLDVVAHRARSEYKVELEFEASPFQSARWIRSSDEKALASFIKTNASAVMADRDGDPVFMAQTPWELDYKTKDNESIEFLRTKELQ